MKKIAFIFAFFVSFTCSAQQDEEMPKEQIDMIKKIVYQTNQKIFKEDKSKELTGEVSKDHEFPWVKTKNIDKQLLLASLDTLEKNIKYRLDDKDLKMESFFPAGIDKEVELFEIKLLDYDFENEKSEKVQVDTRIKNIGFGSEVSFAYNVKQKEGSTEVTSKNVARRSFNNAIRLDRKVETLRGVIKAEFRYVADYYVAHIKKTDKNREFKLGEKTYKVLDIENDKVIIQLLTPDVAFDCNYQATSKDNLKYNVQQRLMLSEETYNFFKANPNISFEEFSEYFDKNKKLILDKNKQNIAIFLSNGEIHNLYLFEESGEILKVIESKVEL